MTAGKPDILGISGRTAIVSGSTRGVGLAIAAALAAAGANVALNYLVNEEQARRALARVRERGVKAIAVRADVSSEEDARRLVSEAEAHLGPVDILVNNAHGKIVRAKLPDSGWELHQQHIDAILRGAFNLSRHVVEGMKTRGWGRIVNMGNNMVLQPIQGYSALTSASLKAWSKTRTSSIRPGKKCRAPDDWLPTALVMLHWTIGPPAVPAVPLATSWPSRYRRMVVPS